MAAIAVKVALPPISEHGAGQGLPPTVDKGPAAPPVKKAAVAAATVKTTPAPAAKKTAPGPLTVAQQATAEVQPQLTAIDQSSASEQAAARQFAAAILAQLQGGPAQTDQEYNQAQGVTNALATQASSLLSGANPNPQIQQLLQSIGAPGSQQSDVASKLQSVFGGGAGVLYDTQGAVPGSTLALQHAAASSFAGALPGIEGVAATDADRNLLYQTAMQKAAVAAQIPSLENTIAAAQATAAYRASELGISQQNATSKQQQVQATARNNAVNLILKNGVDPATGELTPASQKVIEQMTGMPPGTFTGMSASTAAGIAKAQIAEQQAQDRINIAAGNATTSRDRLAASQGKIDPSVSKILGYAATADGSPVVTKNGKKVTVSTGAKALTGQQTITFLKGLATTKRVPALDANGNTQLDKNSKVEYTEQTQFRMPYAQAYTQLMSTPGMTDTKARSALDTIYPKGQGGRAWLTNTQQAALQKSGAPSVTGVIDIANVGERHYITQAQATTLRSAKALPSGFWYKADQGHTVYVIKPGY